jgi:MFS family permease
MQKGPSRGLLIIFLTVFIDLLGFGIVIPLLPIYSRRHGVGAETVGFLMASFSAMQFFFAPMWGRISDRIGRRPVLIGGLLGTSASYVLFGFANTLPLLFASRLLAGFFGANVSTAFAYISDVTTPQNRAKGMGVVGAAFGLGFTLGPWMGGELAKVDLGIPGFVGMPGFVAAALSLGAAIFGFLNLKEPDVQRDESSRSFGLDTLKEAVREPRIGTLFLLNFLAICAFAAFESMFVLFGLVQYPTHFGVPQGILHPTPEQVLDAAPLAGRYLGCIGIISALIQGGLIRRLVPKFGETKLIIAGPFLLGVAFLMVGLSPTFAVVIAGCILMPVGFGLNNPSLAGLISRASPRHRQGSFLGLNQSVASLARMVAPPVAGRIFDHVGARMPFLVGTGALFLSTWIAARYRSRFGSSFSAETT